MAYLLITGNKPTFAFEPTLIDAMEFTLLFYVNDIFTTKTYNHSFIFLKYKELTGKSLRSEMKNAREQKRDISRQVFRLLLENTTVDEFNSEFSDSFCEEQNAVIVPIGDCDRENLRTYLNRFELP